MHYIFLSAIVNSLKFFYSSYFLGGDQQYLKCVVTLDNENTFNIDFFLQIYLKRDNNPVSLTEGTLLAVGGRYDYLLQQMADSEYVRRERCPLKYLSTATTLPSFFVPIEFYKCMCIS